MLLLDCQAIAVTDGVERWCVSGAALTAADENEEVNQSDEMHGRSDDDATSPEGSPRDSIVRPLGAGRPWPRTTRLARQSGVGLVVRDPFDTNNDPLIAERRA